MPRQSVKMDEEGRLLRLGTTIRAARKERGLSQEALADASGIDRSHMGKIERGERNVSILNVARISDALGITMSELLTAAQL